MKIRSYKNEDISFIESLGKKLHNNYIFSLDVFSNCFVCIENNTLVGFITYSIIYERAEIIDLFIVNNYRRCGYAKKLINKVTDYCKDKACKNITLEVNENNKVAITVYNKLGFEVVSKRKNYYENGLKDAYLMEKKLR